VNAYIHLAFRAKFFVNKGYAQTHMNKIKKRDGRIVSFKQEKITSAISKAGKETGEFDLSQAEKLSNKVVEKLNQVVTGIPTVEQV